MTMAWRAAFRSAPVSPYEEPVLVHRPRSFGDETVRQVVRVHLGGDRLRVRLGNLFGKEPLIIGRAAVAALDTGSSTVAGTDTPVTFDGAPGTRIETGTEAVSDPVDLPATADTDLVVSTYHPRRTGPADYHPFALRTGHVAPGDVVSDRELPGADELFARFHLAGIDVWTDASRRVVALFGDSLTDGVGTTPDAEQRYPDRLARHLRPARMSAVNLGVAGNRLLTDGFGERGISRFDRDVLGAPGVTHVVVQLGLNDIGLPGMFGLPALPATEVIAGLTSLAERARRGGLTVLAATLTPFGGAEALSQGFYTREGEETRQHVNRWIRAGQGTVFDGIADFAHALAAPAAPAALLPEYDSGDHLHPNDAGAEVMARTVHRALLP